jgi:hypothetical protein
VRGPAARLGLLPALLAAAACTGPAPEAEDARRSGRPSVDAPSPCSPYPGRVPLVVDVSSASLATSGPTALDGLTLEQIADFRRRKVAASAVPGLFPADYDPLKGPARRIYQSITPGARWLGPAAYYVANPHLLVIFTCANHVTPLGLFCPDFEVTYEGGRIDEVHTGEAARCWLGRAYDPTYADNPGRIRLVMVNAFDVGFRFAHVDLAACENVAAGDGTGNAARAVFSQSSFFHVGRYGANNLSPEDRNGWLRLVAPGVRTVVTVKLWRARPPSVDEPPALTYRVTADPSPGPTRATDSAHGGRHRGT